MDKTTRDRRMRGQTAGRHCRQRLKGPYEIMKITEVHRLDRPDSHPHALWHIEGNFKLRRRESGYTNTSPVATETRPPADLTSAERARITLAEQSFG